MSDWERQYLEITKSLDEIKKDVPEFGYPQTRITHSPLFSKDADIVSDLLSEAYNRLYDLIKDKMGDK